MHERTLQRACNFQVSSFKGRCHVFHCDHRFQEKATQATLPVSSSTPSRRKGAILQYICDTATELTHRRTCIGKEQWLMLVMQRRESWWIQNTHVCIHAHTHIHTPMHTQRSLAGGQTEILALFTLLTRGPMSAPGCLGTGCTVHCLPDLGWGRQGRPRAREAGSLGSYIYMDYSYIMNSFCLLKCFKRQSECFSIPYIAHWGVLQGTNIELSPVKVHVFQVPIIYTRWNTFIKRICWAKI